MSDNDRFAPKAPPQWTQGQAPQETPSAHGCGANSGEPALNRFLGGSPATVFLRLLFVSLIVGAFLMWLEIRPAEVFRAIRDLAGRIWAMGFDAIHEIADYILAGAAIVVPVIRYVIPGALSSACFLFGNGVW